MSISDSDYQGRFTIPTPKGVYQAAGDTNINTDYAYLAQNIRTERGLLASSYGTSRAFPALGTQIETLARFYRRTRPDDADVYVAAAGGAIYTYTMGTEGWVKRSEGYKSDVWSSVTYETTEGGATVDILILSNAKERIWGTGAEGYPDSIFYSRPYDPFNWTNVAETPELGGGVINQPTWDGDKFIALEPFGGYLLAVKERTIFEIRGTDPSSFTITEAYGTDGPVEERSICTDRTSMLYLSQNGIGLYDGNTLRLLSRDALYETMRMRMEGMDGAARACVCNHIYYLAMCIKENESDVLSENNTVLEYDTERGTFMVRKGMRVKDFFSVGGTVYFTQADEPFEVLRYGDPESGGYLGAPMECLWETPWLDMGKAYMKRDFVLRFTADADADDVPVEMTIKTERREKTRVVLLQRQRKDYRVKIQVSGVRMKLKIRSHAKAAGWRIYGGVQAEYSLDEV